MIKVLMSVIALIGSASMACPDFSGSYSCEGQKVSLLLKNLDGQMVYQWNEDNLIVDGSQHVLKKEQFLMDYSSFCTSEIWRLSSTIFHKMGDRVQVGHALFSRIDSGTLKYAYGVSLYSKDGEKIFELPEKSIQCRQTKD